MIPPIFTVCAAVPEVKAQLGSDPIRLWPFGLTDELPALPYAVFQAVGGAPEMFLDRVPDVDTYTLQVDVYAGTTASLLATARALRDAIEPHAYITRWGTQELDPETKRYRYSFDVDWIVPR